MTQAGTWRGSGGIYSAATDGDVALIWEGVLGQALRPETRELLHWLAVSLETWLGYYLTRGDSGSCCTGWQTVCTHGSDDSLTRRNLCYDAAGLGRLAA